MHEIMVKYLPSGCRLTVRLINNTLFMPFFSCTIRFIWKLWDDRESSMYVQLFRFIETTAADIIIIRPIHRHVTQAPCLVRIILRDSTTNSQFIYSAPFFFPYCRFAVHRMLHSFLTEMNYLLGNSLQYSSHGRLKGRHVSDRMRMAKGTPADVVCTFHFF